MHASLTDEGDSKQNTVGQKISCNRVDFVHLFHSPGAGQRCAVVSGHIVVMNGTVQSSP